MKRAVIIVMDSVGIGSLEDAAFYGDAGADTLGHIASYCVRVRGRPLAVPALAALGIGEAARLSQGKRPSGLELPQQLIGRYGAAAEQSHGKDTPSGHWEIAGLPVLFDWGYFPKTIPAFPDKLVQALCRRAGIAGILKNASDARPAAQGLDELIWKSRNCFREITPVEENRQASDLPVTRGRIFAVRLLGRGSVTANELLWQLQTRRPLALGEAGRLTDAERRQCRNR